MLTTAGATVEADGSDALVVRGLGMAAVGDLAHANGIAVHELTADTRSLEDLFLAWTASPTHDAEEAMAA